MLWGRRFCGSCGGTWTRSAGGWRSSGRRFLKRGRPNWAPCCALRTTWSTRSTRLAGRSCFSSRSVSLLCSPAIPISMCRQSLLQSNAARLQSGPATFSQGLHQMSSWFRMLQQNTLHKTCAIARKGRSSQGQSWQSGGSVKVLQRSKGHPLHGWNAVRGHCW